jgi:hypothetical protein
VTDTAPPRVPAGRSRSHALPSDGGALPWRPTAPSGALPSGGTLPYDVPGSMHRGTRSWLATLYFLAFFFHVIF